MGRPTPPSRTIGVTVAAVVVFLASFLPWGAFRGTPSLPFSPGFLPAVEMTFTLTGWNGSINVLGVTLPNWLVVVAAAAAASFCWLKDLRLWEAPRHSPCVAAGYGLFHAIWTAIALIGSGKGSIGIGLLATLLAFAGMIVAFVRKAPSVILDED